MKKILFILLSVATACVFQIAGFQTIANAAWGGDALVTYESHTEVYLSQPSMDEAPNGDIYIALHWQIVGIPGIEFYKSIDGGKTWYYITDHNGGIRYSFTEHSLAYAAGSEDWVFTTYARHDEDNTRSVMLYRFNPANPGTNNDVTIASGMPAGIVLKPEICTDTPYYYSNYYVYVTYKSQSVDYYPVYFSRSLDKGLTWSTPVEVTGSIGASSYWQTQPDIAYGPSGLYIAFEKSGWNGASWTNQIWVTKSTDFGFTWNTPIQVTSSVFPSYHPRIAVASNGNVMVTYTRDYGGGDTDIESSYSTDEGLTWAPLYLPYTPSEEKEVELSVSTSNGRFHAVYWHYFDTLHSDIWYSWADATNPERGWSNPAIIVNEYGSASSLYARPAVCPNPTMPVELEACVAWTDNRNTYSDIYFDSVSTCGNGVLEGGEDCDDGNILNGDCCNAECVFELYGSPCDNQDSTDCSAPDTCNGNGLCSANDYPEGTQCIDDGNVCTDDECNGLGLCLNLYNNNSCNDYLFCNGADTCVGGTCSAHTGDPCYPLLCDEMTDTCSGYDSDGDGVLDSLDNCIYQYNPGQEDVDSDAEGDACDNCSNHYNYYQEDTYPPQGNGCGDACECEGNFNGWEDRDVDGTDAFTFKADYGRSIILHPCNTGDTCHGDFLCDGDVDGTDAFTFKTDFGRSNILNPCPYCVTIPWCVYQ